MKLLSRSETQEIDAARVEELGHTLEAALAAHGVETRLVGMVVGRPSHATSSSSAPA